MRTFSLGAGADVVKFTSTSADDANTIKNFTVTNDKLSFSKTTYTGLASATNVTTLSTTGAKVSGTDKIYVGTKEQIESLKSTQGGDKVYVAIVTSGDTGLGNIYTVTDSGTDNQAITPVLIGSIDNVAGLSFANFDLTS